MNLDDHTPDQNTSSACDGARTDDPWALARADYLAGGSAAEVCERHGLNVSTLRWRARNEGWRRADFRESPVDAPFSMDETDNPDDDITWDGKAPAADLATSAWLHAQTAIRRGKMIEARGWVRLHRDLSDVARREATDARTVDPLRARISEKLRADADEKMAALLRDLES